MDKETTKKFVTFLKKHNCYLSYRKNCRDFFYPIGTDNNAISSAFTWMSTKEGHNFWCKMDRKWRNANEFRPLMDS